MKKTMLIVAMAMAIAMAVAAPIAMAQVERDSEQDVESGEVDQSFSVTGSGNSSQCAEIQSAAQTGNTQDLVGVIDAAREEGGDVSFEEGGSSVTMSPELATECVQEINQAASAAGGAEKKVTPPPAPVPTPAPAPKAAPAPAYASEVSPASAVKAGESSPASAVKAGESKTLPQSGGDLTSIFALGVGALLVTGGIVARRLIR
ncbi:MAG TPA: hypothetical protein VI027_01920 [Rubrobacteraceae bacterium]